MRKQTFKHILNGNYGILLEKYSQEGRNIFCVPKGRNHNYYVAYEDSLLCILVQVPAQRPWMGSSHQSDALYTLTKILNDYFRKEGKEIPNTTSNPHNLRITVL